MELQVLGTGDAFTARRYNTSFLVCGPRPVLVDAPHALFRLMAERAIGRSEVNDVLVTHVHGDHAAGLQTLLLWKKHVEGRRIRLHTSAAVYRHVRERFFPAFAESFTPDFRQITALELEDYVEPCLLAEEGATALQPGLSVEIRHNWHPTPTLGLKLRGPRAAVAISGDTCYRPELLEQLRREGAIHEARYQKLAGGWLWSADVVYHEAARAGPTLHTLESDLLALPADVRRRIRLVHVADDFVEGELAVAAEGERVPL